MFNKILAKAAMLCLSLMMMFAGVSVPMPAKANPPVTDCTNGCVIVTCSGPTCTVLYCSGANNGCNVIGSYKNPNWPRGSQPQDESVAASGHSPFTLVCGEHDPCAFKFCKGSTCSLFAFDANAKAFKVIGMIDNVDYLIQQSQKSKR